MQEVRSKRQEVRGKMQEVRRKIRNSPAERDKFQETSSKLQVPRTKLYFFLFRIWDLNIIWSLVLGICDFFVRSESE
jgi:hypothetical protein